MTYPGTRREPVTRTVGGFTFEESFAWLEDDSPEALRWQHRQDEYAAAYLADLRQVAALRRVLGSMTPLVTGTWVKARGRWYRGLPLPEAERWQVLVASVPNGPAAAVASGAGLLYTITPAPDGQRAVVCSLSTAENRYDLFLVRADGEDAVEIPDAWTGPPVWHPSGDGFYYIARARSDLERSITSTPALRVYGEAPAPPPLPEGSLSGSMYARTLLQISAEGRLAALVENEDATGMSGYVLGDTGWEQLFDDSAPGRRFDFTSSAPGSFADDEYISLKRDVEIVAFSLDGERTERVVLPASNDVVREGAVVVGEHLVLNELVNVRARLRVVDKHGQDVVEVPLPNEAGAVSGTAASGETRFTFTFSSLISSPALYEFDIASGELLELVPPSQILHAAVTKRVLVPRLDSSHVSVFLAHRADLDLSQPQPALMVGYGCLNVPLKPDYSGWAAAFVEQGGVYVLVNARGGGEYGTQGWHAGRRQNKQGSFDDVYAAAEHLITSGMTTQDRLAFSGVSGGGLLAGAVLTQRPDLFKVVVPLLPLLDMMRYTKDPNGRLVSYEFGDPEKPEEAAWLSKWSPFHNVRIGDRYPAVLVAVGSEDVHTPPWHGRKFVARLQTEAKEGEPVLLRVWPGTHLAGGDPMRAAEWLGFVMNRLEMSVRVSNEYDRRE